MLIRGIYFEGYKASGKPQKFGKQDFLKRVNTELQEAGGADPEAATRAVVRVLDRHITGGEMDDVRSALPKELQGLMPEWILA